VSSVIWEKLNGWQSDRSWTRHLCFSQFCTLHLLSELRKKK